VRCADCNLIEDKDKGIACKPEKARSFDECPFFSEDPYDLNKLLKLVEKPAVRQVNKKA
jgi:hypothetical protein